MKVLFIAQEVSPFLPDTEMSLICRSLPQEIQERGMEIRTFMPKYGCVSERRNQLHEVIRLSGMNLIISEADHPLIIKVASIPTARMQVYFIDNEDYFNRKNAFVDESGDIFSDNDERTIFFARGTLETVRKLRWQPAIVHCHGWFTGLAPLYVKKGFREDPLFSKAKVVYSFYSDSFEGTFNHNFKNKILTDGITKKEVTVLEKPDYISMNKLAINYSDGFVIVGNSLHPEIEKYLIASKKPFIHHHPETYAHDYEAFYLKLMQS